MNSKQLSLVNQYPPIWHDYSKVADSTTARFKYLLLATRNEAITKS